jgi:hypothetical protein
MVSRLILNRSGGFSLAVVDDLLPAQGGFDGRKKGTPHAGGVPVNKAGKTARTKCDLLPGFPPDLKGMFAYCSAGVCRRVPRNPCKTADFSSITLGRFPRWRAYPGG